MSLAGSLSTMSLADLLQWVAEGKKTGRFDFRRGGVVKEVYVQAGVIVGAASNQPTEMLGHFLVSRGKLNEEQLRAALFTQGQTAEFIGQVLVRLKFVSQDDLLQALTERTEEVVYSLFEWDDAEFKFEPGARPGRAVTLISLITNQVLLRGIHRHDEVIQIRAVLPDGGVVLARTSRPLPPEIVEHSLARRVLDLVDGRRTIEALTFQLHASPHPVMKFLYEAHRLQLVEVVGREEASAPATGEYTSEETGEIVGVSPAAAARDRLTKGDPEGALALLEDSKDLADPDCAAVLAAAEAAVIKKIHQEGIPEDAVPELAVPLEQLTEEALRPEEFFLLSRLDGHWTVKDVVTIAPMREIETMRVLRRLVNRNVIRLPVAPHR